MITMTKTFAIEVAHHFPFMPEGSMHQRLHGHSYYIDLTVTGNLDRFGFICDFEALDRACEEIKVGLDHQLLNDVIGSSPSMEKLAVYVARVFQEGQKTDGISYILVKDVELVSVEVYRPSVGQRVKFNA